MKRLISKFFVLTTLMVVFGSQVAVADERPLRIGSFESGNLLCAFRGSPKPPVTAEKCCSSATHNLLTLYSFIEPNGDGVSASVRYIISCSPKEDHKPR